MLSQQTEGKVLDERFRSILNIALHPSTGEGEAAAALGRARALVAKQGLDTLMGGKTSHTHSNSYQITVSPVYMHSFIKRLFKDSRGMGCDVEVHECTGQSDSAYSGLKMRFTVHGDETSINKFGKELTRWFKVMSAERDRSRPAQSKPSGYYKKKKSQPWWQFWG